MVSGTLEITAQNKINSYQYWFDGQYNTAVTQTITPSSVYTLSTQVNTNTLLNGLHVFNIKFKDDSSRFSNTLSTFFFKSFASTGTGTITAYQYWFDQNYSSTVTAVTPVVASYNFINDISTTELLTCLHVIHIRLEDTTNHWSEAISQSFYKATAAVKPRNINAYQYWFDQNYAEAIKQNIAPGTTYTLSAPLNTTILLTGLHVLNVRFLNVNNKWSITTSQFFYKSTLPGSPGSINAYQYRFEQN